jgi:oligo-1,6-glucosidase
MGDLDDLIVEIHRRSMRLVMDLVVNHTSDQVRIFLLIIISQLILGEFQHEWFRQSRSSKKNPLRDWYIWRPGRLVDGILNPPNNWRGMFGGKFENI